MPRTKTRVQEAVETRIERYPDPKPLDPKDLTARGFELDGTPAKGTTYKDIIALVMREDPMTFDAKMRMLEVGDYSAMRYTKEVAVRLAVKRGQMGDQRALDWLADREEGKVIQGVNFGVIDTTQQNLKELRAAIGLGMPVEVKEVSDGRD